MGYRESRDGNEREIVDALEAHGATVQRQAGRNGRPDLLVGYGGQNTLMEVKNPNTRRSGASDSGWVREGDVMSGGEFSKLGERYGVQKAARLSTKQARWFMRWEGAPPFIVETAQEALAAVGISN